ncbi:MAG: hypothetical protein M1833_003239 [Piccolia ochrophora]|nr:MAG: hypothetical protein M1833_003239 [Piccolia ochrophora]
MRSSLLYPSAPASPSVALQHAQQAPLLLKNSSSRSPSLSIPWISTTESPETWIVYENLLLSCLRTRDDTCAHQCLERLTERFGESNERVMALKGMYEEAVAADEAALSKNLRNYDSILADDPTNMPIAKRRVALLRSLSRPTDATAALVKLLEASPTDAEAWSELSDLYLSQGLYAQALFSLEEVLLMAPNAWNMHARMGEIVYISALAPSSGGSSETDRRLVDSLRWFCRSVELCSYFLRGYYGLKLVSTRLLANTNGSEGDPPESDGLPAPSIAELQKLNQLATSRLAEIVRRHTAGEHDWRGYDQAEVIAARELLDRDKQNLSRLNITIDSSSTANGSERSNSYSDGEDSSGVHVPSPSSGVGSQEYPESEWSDVLYPDEDIGPSESASRPRTSQHHRPIIEARPPPPRRQSSRRSPQQRPPQHPSLPRAHRHPAPISPESVDSAEEYPGFARGHHPPPPRPQGSVRYYDHPPPGYAPSYSSSGGYSPYAGSSVVPANGNQLIPFGAQAPYGYSPHPFSPGPGAGGAGYFPPGPPGGHMGNPLGHRGGPGYPGQEMMGYGQGAGYYYNQQGMTQPVYYPIPVMQSPSQTSTPPPMSDTSDGIARLERILLDHREETERKEAASLKAAADKAAAAAAVAAAEEAAAKKKADEDALETAKKIAEAAEQAKAAAEEAAKKAAEELAIATAPAPAPEKKKPIKFKDAVGRKFSFPFDICQTWAGMEDLIRQAFMHVEFIGPHVAEGHYDLIGPNGEIILPQVWETMIEPDWTVVMHMWPIPEPTLGPGPDLGKPPDGPEQVVQVGPNARPTVVKHHGKKTSKGGPPPPPPAPTVPGMDALVPGVEILDLNGGAKKSTTTKLPPLMAWAAGGRSKQSKKAEKKPDAVQHDVICRVM